MPTKISEQNETPDEKAARAARKEQELKYWTLQGLEQEHPLDYLMTEYDEPFDLAVTRRELWNMLKLCMTHPDSGDDDCFLRGMYLDIFFTCTRALELTYLTFQMIDNDELHFSYVQKKPSP